MQWCSLVRIAHLLSARPSMTQTSHSGRPRSKRRAIRSAISSNNWSSLPGRGKAMRHT
ncbi:Uncharacterised protein [Mycobacterium tuberculosis]|uniref:Uncharacterized protein n=1 Tax=Mycobacterium tuberculosis TaxID=1773 RepID=A0A916P7N9_MYCTX|nr:Uncharacterised protein [Mycobacterium tuberculosis]COX69856.1 Uncharacterised protein [Mycobacterium tuberculosis]COZ14302.1 Uncharacterised protein [Mycobacterium tuberculosis]